MSPNIYKFIVRVSHILKRWMVLEKRHLCFESWPRIGEEMGTYGPVGAGDSCEDAAGGAGDIG